MTGIDAPPIDDDEMCTQRRRGEHLTWLWQKKSTDRRGLTEVRKLNWMKLLRALLKHDNSPRQEKFEEIYLPEHNLKWDGRYITAKAGLVQMPSQSSLTFNDKPPARITWNDEILKVDKVTENYAEIESSLRNLQSHPSSRRYYSSRQCFHS